MALLVGDAADLFQDGQVMAHRLHRQSLLFQAEVLVVTDELLVELSEGKVLDLELRFDEFGKGTPGTSLAGHVFTCR